MLTQIWIQLWLLFAAVRIIALVCSEKRRDYNEETSTHWNVGLMEEKKLENNIPELRANLSKCVENLMFREWLNMKYFI